MGVHQGGASDAVRAPCEYLAQPWLRPQLPWSTRSGPRDGCTVAGFGLYYKKKNEFINLKLGGYFAYTPWDTLLLALVGVGVDWRAVPAPCEYSPQRLPNTLIKRCLKKYGKMCLIAPCTVPNKRQFAVPLQISVPVSALLVRTLHVTPKGVHVASGRVGGWGDEGGILHHLGPRLATRGVYRVPK